MTAGEVRTTAAEAGSGDRSLPGAAVAALGDRLHGQVIKPGDDRYDQARRVWNGSIDRYPALVACCLDQADIQASLRFAREHDLVVAVRGGGHNVAGSGTCDGGIVIDLSGMKQVRVDPASRTAWAQPGLLWGELDKHTQAHGLAVPGGIVSTTGIAGFTLGGGLGWLHRPFGLTVDSLIAVDVVTADGEAVRASQETNPQLWWALKGGGGNFGIATSFEYRLHPLGPQVMAGPVFYRAQDLVAVVGGYRELMASAPDELTSFLVCRRAPAAPFLPEAVHGQPVVAVITCHAGSLTDAAAAVAPLRTLAQPLADLLMPREYGQFQSMFDGSWVAGFGNYWKAEYLTGLPDPVPDLLAEHLDQITSGLSDFKMVPMGGAGARVPAQDSAFAHREAAYVLNINARWSLPGEAAPHVEWTQRLWTAMRPYSAGGVYVNFLGDEGPDRVRAAYDEPTYQKLVGVKTTYDPDNVFRLNQNIPPAGRG